MKTVVLVKVVDGEINPFDAAAVPADDGVIVSGQVTLGRREML